MTRPSHPREAGFTLIEMMIVVALIAILASVALVAYRRHLRKGYVVEATEFVSRIVSQEELLRQRTGNYYDVGLDTAYPALVPNDEPSQKAWTSPPAAWKGLGLRPEKNASYFGFVVRASTAPAHALTGTLAATPHIAIPPQPTIASTDPRYIAPHPWFYVLAVGDMDGDDTGGTCNTPDPATSTQCTLIVASSANPAPRVLNPDE